MAQDFVTPSSNGRVKEATQFYLKKSYFVLLKCFVKYTETWEGYFLFRKHVNNQRCVTGHHSPPLSRK